MSSIQWNAVLLEVSNKLSDEQLNQLKFLCRDTIGKRELEKIDTGIKLFTILLERGKLGADNKDYLCQLLSKIQRQDLFETINGFRSQSELTDRQHDVEENGTV